MAHRILIFSIAMGADYSFYVKIIETHARAFLALNISAISSVELMISKNLQFVHLLRQTDNRASCTSKVRLFAPGNS